MSVSLGKGFTRSLNRCSPDRGQVHSLGGGACSLWKPMEMTTVQSASAVGNRGKEPHTTIHSSVFEIANSHDVSVILKPDYVKDTRKNV